MVITLAGTGTYAWFQDAERSTGNNFRAGTLDLKVSDGDEGFGEGVTATWSMTKMIPGVTYLKPFSVTLQNSGTIAANHVEISFSHSLNELPQVESDTKHNSLPGEMARWIEITAMTYDNVNLFNTLIDVNENEFLDLEDITLGVNSMEGGHLDNLLAPPPNTNGSRTLTMALKFNAGATNDIQGDTLTTTVTFTLNQQSSQ